MKKSVIRIESEDTWVTYESLKAFLENQGFSFEGEAKESEIREYLKLGENEELYPSPPYYFFNFKKEGETVMIVINNSF